MSVEIALFVRPIVPGRVKTRLVPTLGAEGAARLYAAFVRDTLKVSRGIAGTRLVLWVAGDPRHASFDAIDPRGAMERRPQPDGDLGERIRVALAEGVTRSGAALAVGTDAPTLPAGYLALARESLALADVVLGPAVDGGYTLIGVRASVNEASRAALFRGVRWSTPHAFDDTLRRARAEGLAVAFLPPWYDVDDAQGLRLLRLHLYLRPEAAPETARVLSECAGSFTPSARS